MVRIWDEQKFTPADIVDFGQMADRLVPLLKKYAVNDPAAWVVPKEFLQLCEGKELSRSARKTEKRRPRRTAYRPVRSRSAYTVSRARKSR